MEIILPPYVVLILAVIVTMKWMLKLVYNFEWSALGGTAARLLLTMVYVVSTFSPQTAESLRMLVRVGIALLFFDEAMNWWMVSRVKAKAKKKIRAIIKKSSSILEGGIDGQHR